MRLALFKADLSAARNADTVFAGLLAVSLLANLVALLLLGRSHANVRTVLVPPRIDKSFWVEAERVSPEYLEQMTHYLSMLILNVQPGTIEYQNRILRQYVSSVGKAYLAQFELSSGRLLLGAFRETRMDDPFNPDKHADASKSEEGRRP